MSPSTGRVSALTIGNQSITFCSEGGTLLTGGFYIRDNTPFTDGGLPMNPSVNPNLLNSGFAGFNGSNVIGDEGSGAYWTRSYDLGSSTEVGVGSIGGNNAAMIRVDDMVFPARSR